MPTGVSLSWGMVHLHNNEKRHNNIITKKGVRRKGKRLVNLRNEGGRVKKKRIWD